MDSAIARPTGPVLTLEAVARLEVDDVMRFVVWSRYKDDDQILLLWQHLRRQHVRIDPSLMIGILNFNFLVNETLSL